jgi:hypothetical protein
MQKMIWIDDKPSDIPCDLCGGVVYEFSVPNDIWNRVVRLGGPETDKEYLCLRCFLLAVVREINPVVYAEVG